MGVNRLFADERKAQIATYVQTHKSATVSMLAQMLATSESTIRRDLQELEEHGQLRRTHGGAIAVEVASFEPTWQEKHVRHAEEKARIARCAVKRIAPGQTVLLDGGTTTYQIAKQLSVDGVTVITNSVDIASELTAKAGVHLVVLGGEFRNTTGALVGPFTEQMLSGVHVDIAFLGANGVDPTGITTPNTLEAATKRAMVACAQTVCVVADRSKFGQVSFVRICEWKDVDVLYSDAPLDDPELAGALQRNDVIYAYDAQDGE